MRALLPVTPGEVDLEAAYSVPPVGEGEHHVRMNFVASVDGAAEVGGRSAPLGTEGDRRVFRQLRWLCDVVLVGAGTARAEDYGGVRVPEQRREARVSAGYEPVPPVAVVTGRLDLDPRARLFTQAEVRPILLTCERAPGERRSLLTEVADVVVAGQDAVEPRAAVAALVARGHGRILSEGGPSLHSTLAAASLVDELCLTVAPLMAGPGRTGIVSGPPWPEPHDLALMHVLEENGSLFLRYARVPALRPRRHPA